MQVKNGGAEGQGGDNISGTQNKFKLYIDIYVYIWYNIYGVVCCPTATSVSIRDCDVWLLKRPFTAHP